MLSAGRFAYALPPFRALYFLGVLVDFTNLQPHGESEKQCNRNFINFAAHTLFASLRFPSLAFDKCKTLFIYKDLPLGETTEKSLCFLFPACCRQSGRGDEGVALLMVDRKSVV